MITKLNLSSHPFRNRTLPYLLALLLLSFSVAGAILCFSELRDVSERNQLAQSQVEEMNEELARLKTQGESIQQELTPEQRNLLVAAHKLVANKQFGWSRLFADLEQVLPGSVSASRVSVENVYKTADGRTQAELEFSVLSRNYQSVMEMIERMNSSGIFRASLRSQSLQKSETFTYTEYGLHLIYTPRYGYAPTAPSSDLAQTQAEGQQ